MIRSFLSKVIVIVIVIVNVSITSCSSTFDEQTEPGVQLCDITVTFKGLDISTTPTRATASEAGITHIALKAFNIDGSEAASITQTAATAGDDFNTLKLRLPAGTYTFVAVAHSATTDNVSCATITSATEATLPEAVVPTLYSHVQEVTVNTTASSQSVAIEMGKRINATFHLTSTDVVPNDVASMTIDINPGGTNVNAKAPAKFNPSTGFAIGNLTYGRKLPSTTGQQLDASFNILLPEDSHSYAMNINASNGTNTITDYSRTFSDVPFQRAYTTNASGICFRYVNGTFLTFDKTIGEKVFTY